MRILGILAIIAASATPALAHYDIKDREDRATVIASAQVEKASLYAFDASSSAQKAGRNAMVDRDR